MAYFGYLSALLVTVFVGIFVACKGFGYEISITRMIVAAVVFTALSAIPIPIPFVGFLLPALGLYIALMDDTYDRSTANKVFGFTFVFAVLVTLGLLHLTGRL